MAGINNFKTVQQDNLVLYSYFRSSCAWRVRIALAYKGIKYDMIPVQLMKSDHLKQEFLKLNPMGQVPALVINQKTILFESLAILEYLEERYPETPLLPKDQVQRAIVRQICGLIVSGIQPLQNLKVLNKRSDNENEKLAWAQYFIHRGLTALEKVVEKTSRKFCVGDQVSLADVCLVPQIANAYRFKVDTSPFPVIMRIEKSLCQLPAFQVAHASNQIDCPPEMYSKL